MLNPGAGLLDTNAEWVEITNVTGDDLVLNGCRLVDNTGGDSELDDGVLRAGDAALLVRSQLNNGGLVYDGLMANSLADDVGTLSLNCPAGVIDGFAWDGTFPITEGASLRLDPASTNAAANDLGANWCAASRPYARTAQGVSLGTPGAANPACD